MKETINKIKEKKILSKIIAKVFTIETLKNVIFFLVLYIGISWFMGRGLIGSGTEAPTFKLKNLQGKEFSLNDLKGRESVIYFWATWCSVCKVNIPLLNHEADDSPDFISIVADSDNLKKVKEVVKDKEIEFPVLLANSKVLLEYKIVSFPTTYFIDKNGRIALADKGLLSPMGLWWRKLWAKIYGLFQKNLQI